MGAMEPILPSCTKNSQSIIISQTSPNVYHAYVQFDKNCRFNITAKRLYSAILNSAATNQTSKDKVTKVRQNKTVNRGKQSKKFIQKSVAKQDHDFQVVDYKQLKEQTHQEALNAYKEERIQETYSSAI